MPIDLEKTHVKSVVSMHDVIFKKFPEQFSWLDRKIYDYKWRHACENADAIIAISESTKKDLVALYGAEERKIHVVYQPCANNFREDIPAHLLYQVREKYQLPQEYLLYVGSLISRKQVPLLIEALAHLGRDERLTLVLVGNGPEKEAIEHIAKKMSVMHKLRWMHGVSNEELPAFYKMATAFVYPSIYEGFGIPVVEAMSCGTPVITANISSMPEAGGPHTAYFEAGNADSLTTVLSQVLRSTERQKKMSQEGLAYSQRFHPQIISQALMNVYKSVLR